MFGVLNTEILEYAVAMSNLVNSAGKQDDSIKMMKIILKASEKVYGLDHNTTLEALKI
jgi:hypothetical protein